MAFRYTSDFGTQGGYNTPQPGMTPVPGSGTLYYGNDGFIYNMTSGNRAQGGPASPQEAAATNDTIASPLPVAPPPPVYTGPSQSDLDAKAKAEQDKIDADTAARDEETRITQGGLDRDSAFGNYTTAAGDASSYVDRLIAEERSQAALSGTEYLMTDELRQERINNQFSTIYSENDYNNLVGLYDEFGNPEGEGGYADFVTVRGTGPTTTGTSDGDIGISGGRTPRGSQSTFATAEENLLSGGGTSILGG